jgi:hypothetical protein
VTTKNNTKPRWKRDGRDWVLVAGKRRFGRVVPDDKHPGMWRSILPGGRLSDMANLSWARNAVLEVALRELEYEAKQQAVRDPRFTAGKGGVFEGPASRTAYGRAS